MHARQLASYAPRNSARRRVLIVAAVVGMTLTAVLAAGAAGLLRGAELASVDARFRLRGSRAPRPDVVVVAVDTRTLSALDGRPPYPRSLHARVIDILRRAGAKVIAYDVQFIGASEPREDRALIDAVRRARPVVLATHDVEGPRLRVPAGVRDPARIGAVLASVGVPTGADGVIREMLHTPVDRVAFDVATAQLALGHEVGEDRFDDGYAWIDFAGPPGTFRTVSFSDVLRGQTSSAAFRDKVVVVGYSDPALFDIVTTPVSDNPMSGPELHANAIATILDGFPLRSAPGWLDLLVLLTAVAVTPLVGSVRRAGWVLVAAGGGLVVLLGSLQLAFDSGLIMNATRPTLALVLATVGTIGFGYLLETRERRRVRVLFERFVPADVVDEVIRRTDDDLRLGGVRRVSTVLFTDLRGFTTFAEELEPEQVVAVVNEYLGEMSEAILAHGGTLVSYMGDGIMALFGAPLEQPDHADRALRAVSEMLDVRLARFNDWIAESGFEHVFRMGIGVNSGPVMSGNVGSARRLEYTALGDTTNTAARLEGMTKDTPHQVLIAEATRRLLTQQRDDLVRYGEAPVRGRAEPIELWTLADGRVSS